MSVKPVTIIGIVLIVLGVLILIYQGITMKNRPREQVATKTDISGSLQNPKMNTYQSAMHFFRPFYLDLNGHRQKPGQRMNDEESR